MRVATLNVWGWAEPWAPRLGVIRRALARTRPDVIGLQEIWRIGDRCQAEEIADGLGYTVAYAPACRTPRGLLGNALLSRTPLTEVSWEPLPVHGFEPRVVLSAVTAGVSFSVTHLNWEPGQSAVRAEQARFVADRMRDGDAVLLGDLNATPESPEIALLADRLTDAWTAGGDGSPGHTFDRANGYALRADEPTSRIDYVFTTMKVRSARLAFTEPEILDGAPVWPSDHYGLVCEVEPGAVAAMT